MNRCTGIRAGWRGGLARVSVARAGRATTLQRQRARTDRCGAAEYAAGGCGAGERDVGDTAAGVDPLSCTPPPAEEDDAS